MMYHVVSSTNVTIASSLDVIELSHVARSISIERGGSWSVVDNDRNNCIEYKDGALVFIDPAVHIMVNR